MEYSGLIIGIVIAIFLAMDAPKHNKRPVLWAILGFLFGPIGLGIYLIQTNRKVIGWIITVVVGLGYVFFMIVVVLAALFVTAL
jgi:ABC-type molybdate transport system permease subunit